MSVTGRSPPGYSGDNDVDRFIKESSKSYKECNVKNNARRNSLQKKTLGIEVERKMASADLSREERLLREQLKNMKIEKLKHTLIHNIRDNKKKPPAKAEKAKPVIPIEPYPITLKNHSDSSQDLHKQFEREGSMFAARRGRRESKELEDLKLDTGTGTFLTAREDSDLGDSPRRRVYSMSVAEGPKHRNHLRLGGTKLRRKVSSARGSPMGGSSTSQSRESMDNLSSLDDLHWAGDPEAIHSVRRSRRTVEEQELEMEIHKSLDKRSGHK